MAVNRKRLMTPGLLTDSTATKYTVGANKVCKDIELHFTNTDTANSIGVTVFLVESGGTAGASNTFLSEDWFILAPNESRSWGTDQVLSAGDSIQAKADTTSKIAMFASGSEIT